jgi:conjugative relaxase-like TrwC/TraI family protein
MLSVVDLDPGRANYYLSRGKYEYLQGEGAELVWYGRGASALGLVGQVREQDYRNLFQGFLRGRKLVQNAGKEKHIAGKDLCFSAPKSVSSVWAVSDAKTRAIIESSQLRAVSKALDYLQENATVVRTGKGGKERERAGLIAALAMHGTSRADPPEPQLHTHATLFAVGVTPDGKTRSTVQELPFLFKMSGGAYYRCELARLLEKEAGYRIYRPVEMVGAREEKKSTFEIVDVPDSLIDHWSSRSKEDIANALAEKGLRGAEGKAIAALATRKAKKGTPMKELFIWWRDEAREYGFSQQSVRRGPAPARDETREVTEAMTIALKKVTRRNSHFAERDLVQEVAIEAQDRGLGCARVTQAVQEALQNSAQVVRLGTVKHEPRFTTREVFEIESSLLTTAEASKGKNAHTVRESNVLRAILETQAEVGLRLARKIELTPEQTGAVRKLTGASDQIAVLTGEAGSGKGVAAKAAMRAFELEGFRVIRAGGKSLTVERMLKDLDLGILDEAAHHIKQIGRAFAQTVYEDLKKTPIVGRLLPRGKKPYQFDPVTVDKNTVVFVDCAERVSVKEMEELTRKVMERGGKLCLIGDGKVAEGPQALRAVERTLGSARLTENFRSYAGADRAALRAIARGEAKDALKSFAERGLVHVAKNRSEAMQQMVSDWAKDGVRKPKENLLICSTAQEQRELNRLAQAVRKTAGKLGRKKVRLGADDVHVGDRVTFQKRASYLGIEKGVYGEVLRIGRKRITRKTFHGKQFRSLWSMLKYAEAVRKDKTIFVSIRLDSGKVVEIPLERYGSENLHLGYAARASEAHEVERIYVLAGLPTSRERLYSELSKGRETRIYTDRESAGDGLHELAKKATRSNAKELAHDVLDRNQRHKLEVRR